MAITKVTIALIEDGHSARYTDQGNQRVVRYLVHTNDVSEDYPDNIVEAEDPVTGLTIPALYDADPKSERRLVRSITPGGRGGLWKDPDGADGSYVCTVDVEYNTQSDSGYVNSTNIWEPDPLLRVADESWAFQKVPVVAQYAHGIWASSIMQPGSWVQINDGGGNKNAYTSQKIVNSLGDPYDPPPMVDELTLVGVMERWEANWDGLQAIEYMAGGGAVNEDYWYSFNPGMVKIANITATRRFESGQRLWRVRYEVHVRQHWMAIVEDVGMVEVALDGGGSVKQRKRLNGSGQVLADSADSFYFAYRMNPWLPFAPLALVA